MDYSHYLQGGGTLDENKVFRYVSQADGIIRRHTFGRLDNVVEPPKEAVCLLSALTDLLYQRGQCIGIASESSDGVSVSFVQDQQMQAQITQTVQDYLSGVCVDDVPLLYRGV